MPRPTESLTKPAGASSNGAPAGDATEDVTSGDEIDEPDDHDLDGHDDHDHGLVATTIQPTGPAPSSGPLPSPTKTKGPESADPSPAPVVTHRVSRSFSAAGLQRHPGELVDASLWRFNKSLEAMRYIAPVNRYEPPEVITTPDGRMWDDPKVAAIHASTPTTT